jgi:membrane fusion protein, multidrug efflux system
MRFNVAPAVGCCAIAVAVAAAGCAGSAGAQAAGRGEAGGPAPVAVATAPVEQKSMPLAIDVIGTAEAFSNVAIHPQITGQLTSVTFKEGEDVTKGQTIFTLDLRPLQSALEQAQANLERDTAQQKNAVASDARYKDLLSRGIATTEQADQAHTTAEALTATVASDDAAVANARVQLQYATIAAPISGRTGALQVHEGNLVRAADTTPLVVINQIAPIYVSFGIPEGQLPDLKRYLAKGTVRVQATPTGDTEASEGRITFIDNAVDSTTGQIKIKASFPNDDRRLWPGQFANVRVTLSTEPNAIVVPTAAVQSGQQGDYVFVIKPDKTADLRSVTVERQVADSSVIRSGLKSGEIVVTDGQLRLVPGSKITLKSGEATGARGEKDRS